MKRTFPQPSKNLKIYDHKHLYSFSSTSFIFSPSSSTPSYDTTFSFFSIVHQTLSPNIYFMLTLYLLLHFSRYTLTLLFLISGSEVSCKSQIAMLTNCLPKICFLWHQPLPDILHTRSTLCFSFSLISW